MSVTGQAQRASSGSRPTAAGATAGEQFARADGSRLLTTALLAALVLGASAIVAATRTAAAGFSVLVYLLANLIVFTDFLDFILRLYFCRIHRTGDADAAADDRGPARSLRRSPSEVRRRLRPYAVVVSVHDLGERVDDFAEAMAPWRDRVWIIDDASTDDTRVTLRRDGWRCIGDSRNRKKPGAVRRLIEVLPAEIETIMVIDPDILIRDSRRLGVSDLEAVIVDFQRSGKAALCPRITIADGGVLGRLQRLEYGMAFALGRSSLANQSVTSGIAIYRRDALAALYEHHSMSVYGEDFENSVVLLGMGEEIYYDGRLVVETEGATGWRHWFSQRVGWSYGLVRVYATHLPTIWRTGRQGFIVAYQFLVYLGLFALILQPLKLIAVALLALSLLTGLANLFGFAPLAEVPLADPGYFAGAYAKYFALMVLAVVMVVPRDERLSVLPVVPLYFFYALAQVVPASIGYLNWITLKAAGRRVFSDHYQDDASLAQAVASPMQMETPA